MGILSVVLLAASLVLLPRYPAGTVLVEVGVTRCPDGFLYQAAYDTNQDDTADLIVWGRLDGRSLGLEYLWRLSDEEFILSRPGEPVLRISLTELMQRFPVPCMLLEKLV